jgi:putative endonuclease
LTVTLAGERGPDQGDPRALATAGEDLVARWYEERGYAVLARNWRTRSGELDLIVGRSRIVVFCEVKTRRGDGFGAPAEAVTRLKRQKLRVLAASWLDGQTTPVREVRFDVASVLWPPGQAPVIEIIEGAF